MMYQSLGEIRKYMSNYKIFSKGGENYRDLLFFMMTADTDRILY